MQATARRDSNRRLLRARDAMDRDYADALDIEALEPVDRFYGVDAGLRDPFGNHIRITQPAPDPIELPEKGARL